MKNFFTLLSFLAAGLCGIAQTYNSPESLEFDYAGNRWLISNNSGNNILARNSATGALTLWTSCSGGPHGIEIINDTVYVCTGSTIKMFNRNTAASLGSITCSGASFLNGITHDATYLYATDFTNKTIWRINIFTHVPAIFVSGLAQSPNGILYDGANNRCVFVNWGASAPIKAFDVTSGAVSTVTTTTLGNCDGIAMDGSGTYWYVSSWTGNKITRFTGSTFTSPLTVVTGLSSPADIFYCTTTDTLGNPNSGTLNNTTYHYFGSATGIASAKEDKGNFTVVPNPVSKTAQIDYLVENTGKVSIQLFDEKGALVKTILEENQNKGAQTAFLNRTGISAGTYMISITTSEGRQTKRIVITE
jgi:hypothetical protein